MKRYSAKVRRLAAAVAIALAIPAADAQPFSWTTIVNNGVPVPGTAANFNSYNQPAVNSAGLVVFRARGRVPTTTGEEMVILDAATEATMVVSGVFMRDMAALGPITKLAKRGDPVPAPNNTLYNGLLSSFTEFPSSPRIDANSSLVATRGQSLPVYTYLLEDGVSETRVGTSGVYANLGAGLITGSSLLGAVKELQPGGAYALSFPHFSVPDAPAGTRFDQFPGSPSAADATKIAFKGNFTNPADTLGYTGVYFRDLQADEGRSPITLVASSLSTLIPNQPAGGTVRFGATAAPSAANGFLAFTGWDNEDAPTMGGIYRAPIAPSPPLQTLAAIGDPVPGEPEGATFRNFGEGLSMSADGRYVAFWATWGTETTPRTLVCPADGNADLKAYCLATYPAGHVVGIPVKQGIFVADSQSGRVYPLAKAGVDGITDFLYWVFSGSPPGVGGSEDDSREPPRWRSSAFAALAGKPGELYGTPTAPSPYQAAFKAARNGVDGIYLRKGQLSAPLDTLVETLLTQGQSIDAGAPAGSIVTAVGIERDAFRHDKLALAVSMLYETVDTSLGWAGLYLTQAPALTPGKLGADLSVLDFGAVDIGAVSAAKRILVTNTGQRPVLISLLAVNGEHYSIAGNDCPASLEAAASCSVDVKFSPMLIGPHAGSLSVNGTEVTVALGGTGVFGAVVEQNIAAAITQYYGTLLGRNPDAQGLAYWRGEVARMNALGADNKEVFYAMARAMLSSPEYLARNTSDEQFIADLYNVFLMRAPDSQGVAYWLGQLGLGLDRRVLISAFMFSEEFTAHMGRVFGTTQVTRPEFHAVIDLYRGFMNRLPDSDGFAFWLREWQLAQCAGPARVAATAERMSSQFVNSPEFAARFASEPAATRIQMIVASLYDTFMRRGADAEGFNYWVARIAGGTATVDDVRNAFIASPEFQARITAICAAGCVIK